MISKAVTLSLLAGSALAVPLEVNIAKRSCPNIHVFGARETTVSPGYGSSITVVDDVLNAYPGSTSEAISYPACGGQASCGDVSYSSSVAQGIAAVASAVNSFNSECPDTQLVLVGYSQVSWVSLTLLRGKLRSNQAQLPFRAAKSWMRLCAAAGTPTKATPTPRSSCPRPQ